MRHKLFALQQLGVQRSEKGLTNRPDRFEMLLDNGDRCLNRVQRGLDRLDHFAGCACNAFPTLFWHLDNLADPGRVIGLRRTWQNLRRVIYRSSKEMHNLFNPLFQGSACFLVASRSGKDDLEALLAKISLTKPNPLQPAYTGPVLAQSTWNNISVTILPYQIEHM